MLIQVHLEMSWWYELIPAGVAVPHGLIPQHIHAISKRIWHALCLIYPQSRKLLSKPASGASCTAQSKQIFHNWYESWLQHLSRIETMSIACWLFGLDLQPVPVLLTLPQLAHIKLWCALALAAGVSPARSAVAGSSICSDFVLQVP